MTGTGPDNSDIKLNFVNRHARTLVRAFDHHIHHNNKSNSYHLVANIYSAQTSTTSEK